MSEVYDHDLDMLVKITQALLIIQEQMEKNPVTYPKAQLAYTTVLFGLVPRIQMKCQKFDTDCVIQCSQPVGGLDDSLKNIQEAIEALQMEIELGSLSEKEALEEVSDESCD